METLTRELRTTFQNLGDVSQKAVFVMRCSGRAGRDPQRR